MELKTSVWYALVCSTEAAQVLAGQAGERPQDSRRRGVLGAFILLLFATFLLALLVPYVHAALIVLLIFVAVVPLLAEADAGAAQQRLLAIYLRLATACVAGRAETYAIKSPKPNWCRFYSWARGCLRR